MAQGIVVDMGDFMNNLKRKYNIYAHSIPKMNLVVHGNDRWRLVNRLQNTRRLYLVSRLPWETLRTISASVHWTKMLFTADIILDSM